MKSKKHREGKRKDDTMRKEREKGKRERVRKRKSEGVKEEKVKREENDRRSKGSGRKERRKKKKTASDYETMEAVTPSLPSITLPPSNPLNVPPINAVFLDNPSHFFPLPSRLLHLHHFSLPSHPSQYPEELYVV